MRLNRKTKKEAEAILARIGLTPSEAIELLYKQIVIHKGLPFTLTLVPTPKSTQEMSKEEITEMLKKSISSCEHGETCTLEEFKKEFDYENL